MTRSVERTTSRRVPVRTRSFSRRLDVRLLVVCGGAVVVGIVATALSVSLGEFPIPLGDVAATLVGAGTRTDGFIIVGLRLPRALVGLGCGMALGVSGLIFQTLVRNPLAAPHVQRPAARRREQRQERVPVPLPVAVVAGPAGPRDPALGLALPGVAQIGRHGRGAYELPP